MWRMLTNIAKTHQRKLLVTLGLVGAENLLLMIYPVFGGWVINAVIDGNIFQSLMYGLVVLLMWMIGALRRAVDTRTFTKNLYSNCCSCSIRTTRKANITFGNYCSGSAV